MRKGFLTFFLYCLYIFIMESHPGALWTKGRASEQKNWPVLICRQFVAIRIYCPNMVSIEFFLATRFVGNQENVSLRMDIDNGDRKGMMQACAAMIDPANTANQHHADAGVFGIPLFVSHGSTNAQAAWPCGFRFYGTDQDRAKVLGECLCRSFSWRHVYASWCQKVRSRWAGHRSVFHAGDYRIPRS